MLKVKVFNIGLSGLEDEINGWLTKTRLRKIHHVAFSATGESGVGYRTIVLLFYEEAN